MVKTIYEMPIGKDGAVIGLYQDNATIVLKESYPLSGLEGQGEKLVDSIIDGAEAKIPGDWDRAILEPLRIAGKAYLATLIGG